MLIVDLNALLLLFIMVLACVGLAFISGYLLARTHQSDEREERLQNGDELYEQMADFVLFEQDRQKPDGVK